ATSVFSVSRWLMECELQQPPRHREHRGCTQKSKTGLPSQQFTPAHFDFPNLLPGASHHAAVHKRSTCCFSSASASVFVPATTRSKHRHRETRTSTKRHTGWKAGLSC